jgi:hypothetical protein
MNDVPSLDMFEDTQAIGQTGAGAPAPILTKPAAFPPPKSEWSEFFDPESECLTIRAQEAIAVYENAFNAVVIRRERNWDEDEDVCICVRPENLSSLIAALQRYLPR